MMRLGYAALLGLSLALAPSVQAETRTAEQKRALIDDRAAAWLAAADVPGVAVAYIEGGQVAWTTVHGLQGDGVPATARTLFNIASMTKPILAETVLRLASDGALSLDEPMSAHWVDPDIAGDPRHEQLTPRIALK